MRAHLALLLLVLAVAPVHAGIGVHVSLGAVSGAGATDTYRAAVTAKVQRTYLGGIKSCYRAALKKRPDLEGKLAIGFTVDKRGVPTQLQTGFDKTLDPCVLKAAKGWRFAVPKDAANATVDATFTIEFTLYPVDEGSTASAQMLTGDPSAGGMAEGKRRPGADLGKQIAEVKEGGNKVGTGGGAGSGGRATGDPGTSKATPGPNTPKVPVGRITVSDKQSFDESTLTVDVVLAKVQSAYFAGLKRCYKSRLAIDPTMRGKLKLEFTVNKVGLATGSKARGFEEPLDACITSVMANWRFPIPKDRAGEPTEASFSITLTLVPD